MKRWLMMKWNTLKTDIRRCWHGTSCARCGEMSEVTNEIYGNDGKQIGWEYNCSWCDLHWRIIRDKVEYLQPDMGWGEVIPKHKG